MYTDSNDVYAGICPARQLLDRIADKWTTLVIGVLGRTDQPLRFSELRRQIGGITQKMLTQTLRDLERDGLVLRAASRAIELTISCLNESSLGRLSVKASWLGTEVVQRG